MKITSKIQLTAVMAFCILTIQTAVTAPGHQPAAGHDRFIMPRIDVAYSGDDNGCVPDRDSKHRGTGAAHESGMNA